MCPSPYEHDTPNKELQMGMDEPKGASVEKTSEGPGRDVERKEIDDIVTSAASWNKGDVQFLVSLKWLKEWSAYSGYEHDRRASDTYFTSPSSSSLSSSDNSLGSGERPGPIDQTDILEPNEGQSRLRPKLLEHVDYEIVPPEAWEKFRQWYGGGPNIERLVIEEPGRFTPTLRVEVYPVSLRVILEREGDETRSETFEVSVVSTVRDLKESISKVFDLTPLTFRLWTFELGSRRSLLQRPSHTLHEAQLSDGGEILVEEQVDGEFALPLPSSTTSYGGSAPKPGLVGLSNLGNTCFMNSGLQCLSNCPPLMRYFVSDKFEADINKTNPLGTGGVLAEEFAVVMKGLWLETSSYFTPRDFKWKVAQRAPRLGNGGQHDSQELLAYLLDGLHEDLNLVVDKPYVESCDSDGRPDSIVAAESWDNHLKRNKSFFVDWFQGQLKSTLVCPKEECGKTSVTFDPVMYLSLPFPPKPDPTVAVTVVPVDGGRPTKYLPRVPKNGDVAVLRKNLSALCGIPEERLLIAEQFSGRRINKVITLNFEWDSIGSLRYGGANDFFAYEMQHDIPLGDVGYRYFATMKDYQPAAVESAWLVRVFQRAASSKSRDSLYYRGNSVVENGAFIISIGKEANLTNKGLYELVSDRLKRFSKLQLEFTEDMIAEAPKETTESRRSTSPQHDSDDVVMKDSSENQNENGGVNEGANEKESEDSKQTEENDQQKLQPFRLCVTDSECYTLHSTIPYNDEEFDAKASFAGERPTIGVVWNFPEEDALDTKEMEEVEEHKTETEGDVPESTSLSLYKCFDLFTTTETLDDENLWYCNQCKDHKKATKQFELWKLPPVLVIHLKRFSFTRFRRDKIDTVVDFPISGLDLSSYEQCNAPSDDPAVYDLFGVSNHFGSLGGGHYTAFAKNFKDEKWYNFDDSHVSETSEESIKTSAAYVLFYKRRNTPSWV